MSKENGGGISSPVLYFKNLHKGKTVLLLGNGKSLRDVPLALLTKYPTIGSNTIFESGFIPTYYTAVDHRVHREFGAFVDHVYRDVPKFFPTKLELWAGKNIYHIDFFEWSCVMHYQIHLANYMGFEKKLLVGVDHENPSVHFWGKDRGMQGEPDYERMERIYKSLSEGVINISTHTKLDVYPRGDWREYAVHADEPSGEG